MNDDLSVPDVYAATREELVALALGLDEDQRAATVPMSPEWTVTDVIAHVAGIVADIVAGNVAGAGTQQWTAAQVYTRRGRSVEELSTEWRSHSDAIHTIMSANRAGAVRATADLVAHVHDIAATVGASCDRESDGVNVGLERYVPLFFERVTDAGLAPIRVDVGDGAWQSSDGSAGATVCGSRFEIFRTLSGRRSLAQARRLEWAGEAQPYLGLITPYGLPSEDVVE